MDCGLCKLLQRATGQRRKTAPDDARFVSPATRLLGVRGVDSLASACFEPTLNLIGFDTARPHQPTSAAFSFMDSLPGTRASCRVRGKASHKISNGLVQLRAVNRVNQERANSHLTLLDADSLNPDREEVAFADSIRSANAE
jgi:hypothetical protein